MGKNIKRLFLAAGLLAMTGILLTGCGSKKKNAEDESVIKISMAPEPTATPDPKTVDPDAVTTNGNLTMVNEYLAENGGAALGTDAVTPTPAASDGSGDNTDETGSDSTSGDGTDTSDTGDVADDGSDAGDDESRYDTGDGEPISDPKYASYENISSLLEGKSLLFRNFRTERSPRFLLAEEHLPFRILLLWEQFWIRSEISFLWPRMLRSPSKQIRGLYIKKNFRNTGSME